MKSHLHINKHTRARARTHIHTHALHMFGIINMVAGCESRARGGEKGRERVGGSERKGEKERQISDDFFILPYSSSMREDIIRDRAFHRQKQTLYNPRLVVFHPPTDRSNNDEMVHPFSSH